MNCKETLMKVVCYLSEEACSKIVMNIAHVMPWEALANEQNKAVVYNAAARVAFDESKHPRAEDGRWTKSGAIHPVLRKRDAERLEKAGKRIPTNDKIVQLGRKIDRQKDELDEYASRKSTFDRETYETMQRGIVKTQRELYEAIREAKHAERAKIEDSALKRHMKRLAKEFHDVDDEIDYLEETYGGDSEGSLTAMTFPETRKGKRDKAKYEKLCKRREELTDEIDWELVDDDE